MAGGTVSPWIKPCLVALCHSWEDQAMPGGTVSPLGGSGHAWWHCVTMEQAMPGGTMSPSVRPCLVAPCHFGEDGAW